MFSDLNWPWVTETMGSKNTDKGVRCTGGDGVGARTSGEVKAGWSEKLGNP